MKTLTREQAEEIMRENNGNLDLKRYCKQSKKL